MRVIAGKAKGRQLYFVRGPGTRPMTNRAKAALFSILAMDIREATFLDLFAGTGQVGIEALSRGAAEVVFVEVGAMALRTINMNLDLTDLEADATIVRADAFKYLERHPQPFDYIFVAPPQYRGWWARTLHVLDTHPGWLREDGWVIVQINPKEYEPVDLTHLILFDQRTYGSVMLCFYALPPEEAEQEGAESATLQPDT
jgi:16S rRNA (guanine(966)-N(2))-methyltransferase RsmD